MENKLRDTFDKIHAEAAMKEKTANLLHEEILRRKRARRVSHMRLAAVCASFLLFLSAGIFSYRLYYTPNVYVDMDVNPSIELSLNRLGRVLEAYPYNGDGERILRSVNVRHQSYEQAVSSLLDEMIRRGYLSADSLVSVTVQTEDDEAEQKLLGELQASVSTLLASHHSPASANVFAVSQEVRACAHGYNLSPAKYLAITQLQEVDPTASYEKCAEHSIREIQQLTEEHSVNHHGEPAAENGGPQDAPADDRRPRESAGSPYSETAPSGHHRHGHH